MSGVWQPIETAPDRPMSVLFWIPQAHDDQCLPGQDFSFEVGFWSRGAFREQGTGHDIRERLESWGGDGETYPTHWTPLPDAPVLV